jgi:hypothetical protein
MTRTTVFETVRTPRQPIIAGIEAFRVGNSTSACTSDRSIRTYMLASFGNPVRTLSSNLYIKDVR